MTYIFHTYNNIEIDPEIFEAQSHAFGPIFRDKLHKYLRWQDRQASLFGRLLLRHAIRHTQLSTDLPDIVYNKFGKPQFINGPHFNISHSGQVVVCALSVDDAIGIDVEKNQEINIQGFQSLFWENEWLQIQEAQDKTQKFYEFWTQKEAMVKAIGKGLNIPMAELEVSHGTCTYNHVRYHLHPIALLENHVCHLATALAHTTSPRSVLVPNELLFDVQNVY